MKFLSIVAIVLWGATLARAAQPPEPRKRSEVETVLKAVPQPETPGRPLHILLVAGPKDHGPGEHDYPQWQKNWAELLSQAENVQVSTAFPWPKPEQWEDIDLAVFYFKTQWNASQLAEISKFQERGGGVATIHWAIGCDQDWPAHAEKFGLSYKAASYRHGPVDLQITLPDHPIARGLPKIMHFVDEPYWPFIGDPSRVQILATSAEKIHQGDDRRLNPGDDTVQSVPVFWTYTTAGGKGRVFVSIFGHYMWTFDDPYFRILMLRGMAWAGGENPYRFDSLATRGVKLAD